MYILCIFLCAVTEMLVAILNICSEDELGDQENAALDMSDGEHYCCFASGFPPSSFLEQINSNYGFSVILPKRISDCYFLKISRFS